MGLILATNFAEIPAFHIAESRKSLATDFSFIIYCIRRVRDAPPFLAGELSRRAVCCGEGESAEARLEFAGVFQRHLGVLVIGDVGEQQLPDLRPAAHVHVARPHHVALGPALEALLRLRLVRLRAQLRGSQVLPAGGMRSSLGF